MKVLFLDIGGVLTDLLPPEKRKVKDEAMDMLVKAKEKGYEIFVFITARSGPWVLENLVPKLKKNKLFRNSIIYCENGAYRLENGKIVLSGHAKAFLKIRSKLEKLIKKELKHRGVDAIDATKKARKIVQIRFIPSKDTTLEKLARTCEAIVKSLNDKGIIPNIKAEKTRHGVNIYPKSITKGGAAKDAEKLIAKRYGEEIVGDAFGDIIAIDKEMAWKSNIQWHHVEGLKLFIRKMAQLLDIHQESKEMLKLAGRGVKSQNSARM